MDVDWEGYVVEETRVMYVAGADDDANDEPFEEAEKACLFSIAAETVI